MNIGVIKKKYEIDLQIGLNSEEDIRAFKQIFIQWMNDHDYNSNSVTHQKTRSISREILNILNK